MLRPRGKAEEIAREQEREDLAAPVAEERALPRDSRDHAVPGADRLAGIANRVIPAVLLEQRDRVELRDQIR